MNGIKGHIDCKIDGEVVDIKSTSGFSFNKFKNGTLPDYDSFGYMSQLAGYEAAEGTNNGGFLAINKETGELWFFQPDELDKPDIIIVEGFKNEKHAKIEIISDHSDPSTYLFPHLKNVIGIVVDSKIETSIKQFKKNEIAIIANYILKRT